MTYSEKREIYELMMWAIARIVKTTINKLDINSLNESVNYNNYISQLIDAINCALNEAFNRTKWTEERIKEYLSQHPQITSRRKFQIDNQSAYNAAKRLGIIDDLLKQKYHNWSEENIQNYLDDHPEIKTRNDFRKSNESAYNAAKRLGILDDLVKQMKHIWTKEECKNLASKCKYRSDFESRYYNAYLAALRNGWLKEITSHMPEQKVEHEFYDRDYVVYVYEIKQTHSAYVGLTYDIIRRDIQHRNPNKNGYDSLGLYCIEHNISIPDPIVIKEHLTSTEARKNEFKYWYKYRDAGWNMINSEKNLGYLGSGSRRWSKESLYKLIEDEPEINSITKLQNYSSAAYEAARRYNVLDDLFVRTRKQWTIESINLLLKEHPEIKTRKDFEKLNRSAYNAAKRLNIIDLLVGYKNIQWSENKLMCILKEHPEIKTTGDLYRFDRNAYQYALRCKLLDKLFSTE